MLFYLFIWLLYSNSYVVILDHHGLDLSNWKYAKQMFGQKIGFDDEIWDTEHQLDVYWTLFWWIGKREMRNKERWYPKWDA